MPKNFDTITAHTPVIFAVNICVARMLKHITRKDAESMLPLNSADDDLIHMSIRQRLESCKKFFSHWIGHCVVTGRYVVIGRDWISCDGISWIDAKTNELVDTEEFHSGSITMFGGPRDGEEVR